MAEVSPGRIQLIAAVLNAKRELAGLSAINPTRYRFSKPQAYDGEKSDHNTKITITPVGVVAADQSRTNLFYNRIALDALEPASVHKTGTRIVHLLPELNEKYGIGLVEEDIVDGPLPQMSYCTLVAAVESSVFRGSARINYIF